MVRVALRHRVRLVAEKLLDGEQVNAVLGEPCRKAVSQIVKPEITDTGLAQGNLEGPA